MGFKEIIVSITFVSLIVVAMIMFNSQLVTENGGNITVLDDDSISDEYDSINATLRDMETEANNTKTAFVNEDRNLFTGAFLFFSSIFNLGVNFMSLAITSTNATFSLVSEVLGIPPLVMIVISSLLILIFVIYIWRLIKTAQ